MSDMLQLKLKVTPLERLDSKRGSVFELHDLGRKGLLDDDSEGIYPRPVAHDSDVVVARYVVGVFGVNVDSVPTDFV